MSESLTTPDGRALAYSRRGSGPALVCHPGGPGFAGTEFEGLPEVLTESELVLLDPRGTGGSDRPADPRAYRIADYVADLEILRLHLDRTSIDLLGFSHGGLVAAAYAAEYPDRVDRLILASTAARFSPEQLAGIDAAVAERSGEPWYEDARAALAEEQAAEFASDQELADNFARQAPLYFASFGPVEQAYLAATAGETVNADALRLFNEEIFSTVDLRPQLARIRADTLVIAGERDFICSVAAAEELAAGIAGSQLVVVPEAGHFTFVEQPRRFGEALGRFLGPQR